MVKAGVPVAAANALQTELLALGAAHVQELTPDDWRALVTWGHLKVFEQRRLLAVLV